MFCIHLPRVHCIYPRPFFMSMYFRWCYTTIPRRPTPMHFPQRPCLGRPPNIHTTETRTIHRSSIEGSTLCPAQYFKRTNDQAHCHRCTKHHVIPP